MSQLTATQLMILNIHKQNGPQPFRAHAWHRTLSTRLLVARELLAFDRRRSETSLTRQGRLRVEMAADRRPLPPELLACLKI